MVAVTLALHVHSFENLYHNMAVGFEVLVQFQMRGIYLCHCTYLERKAFTISKFEYSIVLDFSRPKTLASYEWQKESGFSFSKKKKRKDYGCCCKSCNSVV